jgi:transketolase
MGESIRNYRRDLLPSLVPYFEADERYRLLMCDMGFGVADTLRESFPDRVVNCGIMEQATVGIAAGMSMSGLVPIVYSIVNFLVFRALEQVRNDIVLQQLNVKLIGNGANDYFKFLGPSHCCGNDDIAIMHTIGMPVYDPYSDARPFETLVDDWMRGPEAGYIRV